MKKHGFDSSSGGHLQEFDQVKNEVEVDVEQAVIGFGVDFAVDSKIYH